MSEPRPTYATAELRAVLDRVIATLTPEEREQADLHAELLIYGTALVRYSHSADGRLTMEVIRDAHE